MSELELRRTYNESNPVQSRNTFWPNPGLELRRTYNESNPVQSRNTFWPNPGQIGDFSRQSQAKEECLKRYLLRNGCIEKHQPACRRRETVSPTVSGASPSRACWPPELAVCRPAWMKGAGGRRPSRPRRRQTAGPRTGATGGSGFFPGPSRRFVVNRTIFPTGVSPTIDLF